MTIKWPGVATETELKGPVGNRTCSFDCEKAAFEACVASLTERQERLPLPGAVIFCDCQALLQALSGRSSTGVGDAMLGIEKLRWLGMTVLAQWIPSHVGIPGNERVDKLANEGRDCPQPNTPAILAHCSQLVRRKTAELWRAAIDGRDERFVQLLRLTEARSADDGQSRSTRVMLFRLRVDHSLLQASMSNSRLCNAESESTSHCPALAEVREREGGFLTSKLLCGVRRVTQRQRRVWFSVFCILHNSEAPGLPTGKGLQRCAWIGHERRGPCQVSLVQRELY